MADVEIACPFCEQTLEVSEDFFGQNVECPACGKTFHLDVEPETPAADPATPACPSCGADLQPGAVLCMQCGYHQTLGKRIQTNFG